MNLINLLSINFCLLVCIFVPIFVILKYRKKSRLHFKYLLMGVVYYIVIRILLYPIIYLIIKDSSLILKIIIDILYLGVFSIAFKIFLYKKYLSQKSEYVSNVLSLGFGECVAEIVFTFLPTIINYFLLAITINFGDIYSYFGDVYSVEYIQNVINNFNSIGVMYYLWVSVIVISLVILSIYISYNIKNINTKVWIYIICFYINYLLIPVFSYLLSFILVCILNVYAIRNLKRIKIDGEMI
ncbi:MAG: hypothetical protein RR571_02980 [Anaerorhabdus sp.]|uniref:YhfC family glutamic-type intramembrane protease n=1 Tax=Anaerorhabdus sp. TaxID=1872524 RepID=UPI002FC70964